MKYLILSGFVLGSVFCSTSAPSLLEMRSYLETQLADLQQQNDSDIEYFEGIRESDVQERLWQVLSKLNSNESHYYDE